MYYEIYDLTGRLVITGKSNTDNTEVNVEKLAAGMYAVKLYNGHHILMLTEKIVIR
jgi:hypothetical protein